MSRTVFVLRPHARAYRTESEAMTSKAIALVCLIIGAAETIARQTTG